MSEEFIDDETGEVTEVDIPEIQPSEVQSKAIADIKDWFANRTAEQPVYRLFGYAGTGKTTLTKYAIADLALSMGGITPDVYFGAFTGKAAYVMRKHGTPARTIHSMIYSVHSATDAEIDEANGQLDKLRQDCAGKTGVDRFAADAAVAAMENKIRDMKRPQFGLNPEAAIRDARLIVLDEVSMVGPEMAADLLSFGKPILVLGDPGQLPPIKGEGAFTMQEPDTMLIDIHRQALDSPIIKLATMARNGEPIPYGMFGPDVCKMSRRNIHEAATFLRADQVICGRNATRLQLNSAMREAAGFSSYGPLPSGERLIDFRGNGAEEKIICLRNINSSGLINGMFLRLCNIKQVDDLRFEADIFDEEGNQLENEHGNSRFMVYSGHFYDHKQYDKNRGDRDWRDKRDLVEATFGWAITCHKSQGSQWRNVIVYDDRLSRSPEERKKWLYTAITRAEEGLVIVD